MPGRPGHGTNLFPNPDDLQFAANLFKKIIFLVVKHDNFSLSAKLVSLAVFNLGANTLGSPAHLSSIHYSFTYLISKGLTSKVKYWASALLYYFVKFLAIPLGSSNRLQGSQTRPHENRFTVCHGSLPTAIEHKGHIQGGFGSGCINPCPASIHNLNSFKEKAIQSSLLSSLSASQIRRHTIQHLRPH